MKTEIDVNPTMLSWAITRAGFHVKDFLSLHPNVGAWMEKIKRPTMKQLEDFAKRVHIPFGYLFLNEPPSEEIPFPFFRTGNTTKTDTVTVNVYDTIQILQRRQDWLVDYLEENGSEALPFVGKFTDQSDFDEIVKDLRATLQLDFEWARNFKDVDDTLSFLTQRVEDLGIIINFNGVVENNTRRPISVDECRGFVLVHPIVPFMFVNAADAKAAQLFTIVHELAHIWVGESAGFNNAVLLPANSTLERLCDQVAAEFLVPKDSFMSIWAQDKSLISLAKRFKVSQLVIARRAMDLGELTKKDFSEFYSQFMFAFQNKKEVQASGGNFYATARKRISPTFAAHVNQAVQQDRLLYREAYKITGLKGDTYTRFIQELY